MLQFYIPEVVSVEQVFDQVDAVTEKEFTKLEEKIMTKTPNDATKWTVSSLFGRDDQNIDCKSYNFM